MIAAIHQPNFLPWIGYFYKIANCDIFIILDDVQFARRGFTHRNKIKTPQGGQWITLPIVQKGKYDQLINECVIQEKEYNADKILKSLKMHYSKAPFYNWIIDDIGSCFRAGTDSLSQLNIRLIEMISKKLNINTEIRISSGLNGITGESTERLVSICKAVKASEYLFGFGAKNYQEEALFEDAGITPALTSFVHPVYPQLWDEFTPNLSIIDFLFNTGPAAEDLFKRK